MLAALASTTAGCAARAAVVVTDTGGGAGTVTVTVTLDPAAAAAVGPLGGQVDTAGLAGEGWVVAAPVTAPDGSESVGATHPWRGQADLTAVLDEVGGTPAAPLVAVTLTRSQSLFRRHQRMVGTVDLRCGLGCFGDDGLRRATGSALGADPTAPTPSGASAAPPRVRLEITVERPGRLAGVAGTPAPAGPGRHAVAASVGPGGRAAASLETVSTDRGAEAAAAAGGAVVALVALATVVGLARRRRRPVVHQPVTPDP